jgi:hypothetical protein
MLSLCNNGVFVALLLTSQDFSRYVMGIAKITPNKLHYIFNGLLYYLLQNNNIAYKNINLLIESL